VLFLRTSTFELAPEAIPPVIAAGAGVFGLLTMLAGGEHGTPHLAPIPLLVGVVALGAGLPVLLWGTSRSHVGDRPSKMGPLLTVDRIAPPALLLGVYGLFTTLWNLGQ
jgi:hypothetical protein